MTGGRRAPVMIAGGGLAGGAAACLLARAGRDTVLFERSPAHTHKICGEFLSREAQILLAGLGLDLAALGGHTITHLRLVRGAQTATMALPFQGMGLSRRVLDAALLAHAARAGAEIHTGQGVALAHDAPSGGPLRLRTADGAMEADTLFLATGKHDMRGLARKAVPSGRADAGARNLVGFKTYFHLSAAQQRALAHHVELILFPDGYAGLQMVEDGQANLCLLIDRARLQRAGGWPGLLQDLIGASPHLAQRLDGGQELLPAPVAIAGVPYGFVHRAAASDHPGLFRLGDQMGVIGSFAGDGMSIALHSAFSAAAQHLRGATAHAYHRQMRDDIAAQIRRASMLYRLGHGAAGHGMLMMLAGAAPGLLRLAATLTRVPDRALARHGQAFAAPASRVSGISTAKNASAPIAMAAR